MADQPSGGASSRHSIKKCPECYVYVPVNETRCPSCKTKLAGVDPKTGLAKKPVDWMSYLMSAATIALLAGFLYYVYTKVK